ncbi:hypothetical protein TNIN_209171 [Trichonephila inaurata madagascariensis]|uniref:Uncharacterized protein n=1 Tax=Trichonephila inaurata madagascariensis TaxID=2747483 RepID=A0A8X7CN82_9ARAC|nr:hypothetical protein TNIN_209171 [Trichonephila inaurata madagascariensis]
MDDLDVALVMYLEDEQSSEESELFKNRSSEGAFQILVHRHLHCNDEKFRQYFRLTPVLFDYVLNNIRDELTSKPYNRHKKPICPEEKLCILVRSPENIGTRFFATAVVKNVQRTVAVVMTIVTTCYFTFRSLGNHAYLFTQATF